jgi:hypothetical protein
MRAALAFSLGIVTCLNMSQAARAQAADCASLLNEARAAARDLSASIDVPPRPAIGAPIRVKWTDRGQGRRSKPLPPLYLVVTAPPDARFAGTGFIALTAGAKGPEGLGFGNEGTRAFLPLHRAGARAGEIAVKLYRVGRHALGWAAVTAGPCGEHIVTRGPAATADVPPGAAELVLQERFQTEQPLQRRRARSGRHELLVFKGRYEVHEVATGAKIIDRPGNDPNFSPTGRFVAARGETGGELDVVDTLSAEMIASFGSGLLAWARADSFVFHGGEGNGNVEIVNTLVEKAAISFAGGMSTLSCRICGGWDDVDLLFDIDHGYVAAVAASEASTRISSSGRNRTRASAWATPRPGNRSGASWSPQFGNDSTPLWHHSRAGGILLAKTSRCRIRSTAAGSQRHDRSNPISDACSSRIPA